MRRSSSLTLSVVLKRGSLAGLFSGDIVLGTAEVRLAEHLSDKCEVDITVPLLVPSKSGRARCVRSRRVPQPRRAAESRRQPPGGDSDADSSGACSAVAKVTGCHMPQRIVSNAQVCGQG